MRGARGAGSSTTRMGGIIPADAGSTYMNQGTENAYEDHPRGCGEHVAVQLVKPPVAGSSPRMRGARTTAEQGAPS